jgi:cholesterol oxidase
VTDNAVETFDAVVIGSGFGGSVMTHRLAEAGKKVCLLERGRAYGPGDFPRSPHDFRRAFWDPSEGGYGIYNVWSFRHFGSVVSSGLGGGSLIYANVLIRKDEDTFVNEPGVETWPVTRAELDPHYERAEQMLNAQTYPLDHPGFRTPRTRTFMAAARQNGWDPYLPNLAVTFANRGREPAIGELIDEAEPNLHGRQRRTCRLLGECDIGCNEGAKNSTDYSYLSAAKRLGADIRTSCEVRSFAPLDKGWQIDYVEHDASRQGQSINTKALPLRSVKADKLILSAGTYGSTYLMLKNLPRASSMLGQRFSGNGDLLTLALDATRESNGRRRPLLIEATRGPSIAAAVRFPDGPDGRGFYLEDVGYPGFLDWVIEESDAPGIAWRARHVVVRLLLGLFGRDRQSDIGGEIAAVLGQARRSSSLMPLAGMGRDAPDGVLSLRDGRLSSDWKIDHSAPYFSRVRGEMQKMSDVLGAKFTDNPIWHFGRRVITVHPLGGCPMGHTAKDGVVDSWGRVFGQPGLYVADGSVMPGPVGPNPSLTIAALSDRFADRLLEPPRQDPWPAS